MVRMAPFIGRGFELHNHCANYMQFQTTLRRKHMVKYQSHLGCCARRFDLRWYVHTICIRACEAPLELNVRRT